MEKIHNSRGQRVVRPDQLRLALNRELRLGHGLMTFLAHPGMPVDQGGTSPASELGMGVHGGTDETSMMLHLAPELCDMSKATRRVPDKLVENAYVRFGGLDQLEAIARRGKRELVQALAGLWIAAAHPGEQNRPYVQITFNQRGAELFSGSVQSFCDALREISTFDFGR